MKSWIKNFNELSTTHNRKLALTIAEAGLDAISTEGAVFRSVKLHDNLLSVAGTSFDLSKFKKIKVIGFGKASGDGALALEKILGSKIKEGAIIGITKANCQYIETFAGTHPRPSQMNVEAGKRIYEIIKNSDKEDLIIVLVSGGGSALLCYSAIECTQNMTLYDEFLKSGKTITEINTVRKHLSILKGGGLAKIAYPATVIGLIFSDIAGDNFENVASGPTYKDRTVIVDAEKIVAENNLGKFDLIETIKEDKYFENVHNFVMVSNQTAIEAMKQKSEELGLSAKILSTEMYDEVGTVLKKIFGAKKDNIVVLGAGEPRLEVKKNSGIGGRNLHMGLQAIKEKLIDEKSVFISLASDGVDNSNAAGAVVDKDTIEKAKKLNLSAEDYLAKFDSYNFFKKSGDLIKTGPTGANVADLMILLTKYEK